MIIIIDALIILHLSYILTLDNVLQRLGAKLPIHPKFPSQAKAVPSSHLASWRPVVISALNHKIRPQEPPRAAHALLSSDCELKF